MEVSHNTIKKHLAEFVRTAQLDIFFDEGKIDRAATAAERAIAQWPSQMTQILPHVSVDWKLFSFSVSRLALYDIHLLIDQDSSMRSGTRWRHLRQQVQKTAELIHPFVSSNRMLMHSCDASAAVQINNIDDISGAFEGLHFDSVLPVGLALKQKVLPLMLGNTNALQRPCLVYIFTTGEREDEDDSNLARYIGECKNDMRQHVQTSSAMAIEVVQIGRNLMARRVLGRLELAYGSGDFLDVSSEDEVEDRYRREQGWYPASRAVLAIRNLVGAIEPRFLDARKRVDDLPLYLMAAESERKVSQVRQEMQAKVEEAQRLREEDGRNFQRRMDQRTQEHSAELARLQREIETLGSASGCTRFSSSLRRDINMIFQNGEFPLYRAAAAGEYDYTKFLLDNGAYASMQTPFQWTALHWAVWNGHESVVQLLLDHNASVHLRSDTGKSPLDMARSQSIRQLLISRGAR